MKKGWVSVLNKIALIFTVISVTGCKTTLTESLPTSGLFSSPQPTATPRPTITPQPTATPRPTITPQPTATPRATITPQPTATPRATITPQPTATPRPTATPQPTATPRATATPQPTATPRPTITPQPTATPRASPTPVGTPVAADYYMAPQSAGGSDSNPGTLSKPFLSLEKVWSVIKPGNTVLVRGGTYAFNHPPYLINKNGTSANPIRIWAYPGEKPVFTASANWDQREHTQWYRGGIFFTGNYFHWKGFEITGFKQLNNGEGWIQTGFLARDSNYNIFEQLDVHHNGHGFSLENNATGNLFLNSDFHDNYDPYTKSGAGGSADGLGLTYITEGNSNEIRGCRAWWNTDDGFDVFENLGQVTIENSWAWYNGYLPGTLTPAGNGVGFKLGSVFTASPQNKFHDTVLRTVNHTISAKNRDWGYHTNEGDLRVNLQNNTAYRNVIGGFHSHMYDAAHTFKNNVAFDNLEHQVAINPKSVSTHNSCGGPNAVGNDGKWAVTATVDDFQSLDEKQLMAPRKADGSLPDLTFLRPKSISDLRDAGTKVGLPFKGVAPDIGALEYLE